MTNQQNQNFWRERNKLDLSLILFVILALVLNISITQYLRVVPSKIQERMPETYFTATDQYKAYFEIVANKTTLALNEEVNIDINLYTTGEPFDAATVVLEWDPSKLQYVSDTEADLPGQEEHMDTFVGGNQGRRIMVSYVPVTTPPLTNMTTSREEGALFWTVKLKALENNPNTIVKLSETAGDLNLHFVGSGVQNSIDQSLSTKKQIVFGATGQVSPSPSASGTTVSPSPSPSPSRSPSPSPLSSPSSSPSPIAGTYLNLKFKLDGVPANNNEINLPSNYRTVPVKIYLQNLTGNNYAVNNGQLNLTYEATSKTYRGSLVFGTTQLPSGTYNILVKGPSHRQIRFCKNNQSYHYVCQRQEGINITANQTYNLDFSASPLEFGDVNNDGNVGVQDYSFVKACKQADSRLGQGEYQNSCYRADGNLDGVCDITDIDLLYKTISYKPDDE